MRRVRDLCGEHFKSFIFMGQLPDPDNDDNSVTLSTWDGDFNTAVGLASRMNERMKHDIRATDDPQGPVDGEEWKGVL